jgi:hypothetical protein
VARRSVSYPPELRERAVRMVAEVRDAMHTQREHAEFLVTAKKAHYILIVEHGAHCSRLSVGCIKQSRLAVFCLDT